MLERLIKKVTKKSKVETAKDVATGAVIGTKIGRASCRERV